MTVTLQLGLGLCQNCFYARHGNQKRVYNAPPDRLAGFKGTASRQRRGRPRPREGEETDGKKGGVVGGKKEKKGGKVASLSEISRSAPCNRLKFNNKYYFCCSEKGSCSNCCWIQIVSF